MPKFNKKLIYKIPFYLIFLIFVFTLFELISFDNKYINKKSITFDVDNVRNPQIKKLVRTIDNLSGNIYFSLSEKKKKEFFQIDKNKYNNLPEEILIKAKDKNLTISNKKNKENSKNWQRSHGNQSSNKFSSLKQINSENVDLLDVAWTYKFSEKGVVPGNAIFFEDKIYVSTPGKSLIALSAEKGEKIWERPTEGKAAVRGLMIHENKNIYFCDQKNLNSINSVNGEFNLNFGKKGKIKLKHKCQTTPVIIDKDIIIATFEPGIEVYDLSSGKIKWKFYLKKITKDFFRYGGKRFDYSGGNPWGGISADVDRKIVYISTGNAGRFYEGTSRPGKNKYSNSVIALDISSRKVLWEFQEVEHDIWNYDIASPPILTSIVRNGKEIDVVVAPTKFGNTLVLDRLTGKSLFDYKKIKVPLSDVPGEKTAFYQKKFHLPEAFSKQYFEKEDITDLSPESTKYVKEKIKDASYGFFTPNSVDKKNIVFKGGAQWMGASIDNATSTMYVNSSDMPTFLWLEKVDKKNSYYRYSSNFEIIKDQYGYPGSKPPWGNLTSINLTNGKINWTVPFGEYEELTKKNITTTGTVNFGGVAATAGNLVFATGTVDNKVRAYRATDGEELWSYKMKYLGSSPPTIFEYNNDQYLLIVSTGSYTIKAQFPDQTEFGDIIYAFKLKK